MFSPTTKIWQKPLLKVANMNRSVVRPRVNLDFEFKAAYYLNLHKMKKIMWSYFLFWDKLRKVIGNLVFLDILVILYENHQESVIKHQKSKNCNLTHNGDILVRRGGRKLNF